MTQKRITPGFFAGTVPGRGKGINNQSSGFISLDFIFALGVSMGFAVVFFALATTFAAIEVAQYITFAASRAYAGSHFDVEAQVALGEKKYNELMQVRAFKSIFRNGWFKLGKIELKDFNEVYPQPEAADRDTKTFWGARVPFEAEILNIRIPFIGESKSKPTTGKATLGSYLMREPTNAECAEFTNLRDDAVKQLDSAYEGAPGQGVDIMDNGG